MKNVKKILVLAAVLSVLMCVSVFAAGGTIDTVTAETGSGASFENYAGQVKFDMTYETDTEGMFLVLVVKEGVNTNGGKIAPRAEDILYVNQATSSNGEVSFTGDDAIYPSGIEDGSKIYLAGAGLDELTLMGTIETPEPVGYTVSGNITSYLVANGEVTVALFAQGAETAAYTTTTTTGAYSIAEVEAGEYTMKVSKANHVTREYAVAVMTADITQNTKICPKGDATQDGAVNITDVSRVFAHVKGRTITDAYAYACADAVGTDGSVNITDVSRLFAHVKGRPLF